MNICNIEPYFRKCFIFFWSMSHFVNFYNEKTLNNGKFFYFIIIPLPPEFLPGLGPLRRYMPPHLVYGPAL